MMRRTPMKRGGWHRSSTTTPTGRKSEPNRPQRLKVRAQRAIKTGANFEISKSEKKTAPALAGKAQAAIHSVASVPAASTTARPRPKTKAQRNKHLRQMAQGMACLLQVPGVCTHDRTTVVCCHSNLSAHGKAGARKADDHYSVWGCAACHRWLDQGTAPSAQKTSAFMAAHLRQVLEWRAIAYDAASGPKDRAAALWALERLNSLPNAEQAQSLQALAAIENGA